MTIVVLIRHAEPEVVEGTPSRDWNLSSAGRRAAAALAVKLDGLGLADLSSSPEPKALQTAQIIRSHVGGKIHTDLRLREHDRSSAGFLNRQNFEASIASVFDRPTEVAFGHESADAVYDRFSQAIGDAMSRRAGVVAAVTHGTG